MSNLEYPYTITAFTHQVLFAIESTHAILRFTLVLRKVCQRLFALSYDSLPYSLTSWLDAHSEYLWSHV
jgi:hypothetical protein